MAAIVCPAEPCDASDVVARAEPFGERTLFGARATTTVLETHAARELHGEVGRGRRGPARRRGRRGARASSGARLKVVMPAHMKWRGLDVGEPVGDAGERLGAREEILGVAAVLVDAG